MIAITAAVLLAIVGVVAVVLYANGADQRAVASAQPRPVFVSAQTVPAGTTLNDAVAGGLIVEATLPAKSVPVGSLTAVTDDNKNLLALTEIAAGEYIQSARFGATPQGSQAIRVPNGQIAVALALQDPARVGTFIAPGSHIVLYNTTASSGAATADASNGVTTRVLFEDVLVIAVGTTALTPSQPQGEPTAGTSQSALLVTLALSPAQAPRLVQAVNSPVENPNGLPYPLYAGLRGSDLSIDTGLVVSAANVHNR
jgi:pilus assembly protein CpaB